MSDFIIEILQNHSTIDVEASILNNLELNQNNLILENETATIQINTEYVGSVVFAGDIIGLDTFIDTFLDTAEIDCGSP